MITFKTLLETVYEPKSGDEKNFKDKHVVAKYKTPYDTESQFTSTATKAKRKADYDSKEDEQVYEAAVLHTKRADKEAVIVRAVDPNTGQSKARVVKRGTGEIKIGEAMDPVGKHDADIDNDGDTDKSDKYLIARRKAIGKAIRKEEVELDEKAKWRSSSAAKKITDPDKDLGMADYDYHHENPRSTGRLKSTADTETEPHSIINRTKSKTTSMGKRKGMVSKEDINRVKSNAFNTLNKEEADLEEAKTLIDTKSDWRYDKSSTVKNWSHDKLMKVAKHDRSVEKEIKRRIASKEYIFAKEEVEQIDELSPNTLHSYIKKSADDAVDRAYTSGLNKRYHKKALKRQKGIVSASSRLADKANAVSEEVEQIDEISRDLVRSYIRKVADKNNTGQASPKEVMKRSPSVALAGKKAYGIGGKARVNATESVGLDEAFKIGAMKLKDGSTVTLTRESVDAFNKLFTQLNSANKAKMEERMMSGKSGFQEILGFAENI